MTEGGTAMSSRFTSTPLSVTITYAFAYDNYFRFQRFHAFWWQQGTKAFLPTILLLFKRFTVLAICSLKQMASIVRKVCSSMNVTFNDTTCWWKRVKTCRSTAILLYSELVECQSMSCWSDTCPNLDKIFLCFSFIFFRQLVSLTKPLKKCDGIRDNSSMFCPNFAHWVIACQNVGLDDRLCK